MTLLQRLAHFIFHTEYVRIFDKFGNQKTYPVEAPLDTSFRPSINWKDPMKRGNRKNVLLLPYGFCDPDFVGQWHPATPGLTDYYTLEEK